MTLASQYKQFIIRTSKCLLNGEEINNVIFHGKGDNQGQYSTIYMSSILGRIVRLDYIVWQLAVDYWHFSLYGDPNLHHQLPTLWTEF